MTSVNDRPNRVAVLPGDGIVPEVMAASLDELQAAAQSVGGLRLNFTSRAAGAEHYRSQGDALPQAVIETIRAGAST